MDAERKIRDLERQISELNSRLGDLEQTVHSSDSWQIVVELGEFGEQSITGAGVPPIGSRFEAHKHVTDGGTYAEFEVTGHEWWLSDTVPYPDGGMRTGFNVRVKTRRCDEQDEQ